MCCCSNIAGQEIDSIQLKKGLVDTSIVEQDTMPFTFPPDSLQSGIATQDTMPFAFPPDSLQGGIDNARFTMPAVSSELAGVKISKDGLDDIIDYGAADSSFVDLKENQIHLFGRSLCQVSRIRPARQATSYLISMTMKHLHFG